ncbi:MAG TPA: cyclic nucleotide-binding domain-containing protein [Isosphaeraceae bacterium]|nr:cyclic nucleotide-binding domain-containing protein [Isosphaeraceae bacterium]
MESESAQIAARLKDLEFTQDFTPEQLDRLAELATPVRWRANEVIFGAGEVGFALYLVEEGRVAIDLDFPNRWPKTILTVGRGEVFGWSSVFDLRPKTAMTHTLTPTKALALDAGKLRALCDADPRLGYALTRRLLQAVSERLKATRNQLYDLLSQSGDTEAPHPEGTD